MKIVDSFFIKHWKIFLAIIVSLVLAISFSTIFSPYSVRRGGEEGVQWLTAGTKISQPFPANTKNIHVSFIRSDKDPVVDGDTRIKAVLEQGGVTDEIELDLDAIRPNAWNNFVLLDFNYSKFTENGVTLSLIGERAVDVNVGILTTSGAQRFELPSMSINGEIINGRYLSCSFEHFSVKVFIFYFFSVLIIVLCVWFIAVNSVKVIKNYPAVFILVVIIAIQYIRAKRWEPNLDSWCYAPLFIRYSDGFVTKALFGTFLSLFVDYFTIETIHTIFHIMFLLLVATVVFAAVNLMNRSTSEESKRNLNIVFLLYAVSPFSPVFYFYQWGSLWGRLDIILTIAYILTMLIITKKKEWVTLAVTPLSVVAILTHQYYVFCFYPAVFGVFLYRYFGKKEKKILVPMALNVVLPGALAFYTQFFGKLKYPIKEYMDVIATRTVTTPFEAMLNAEYYLPVGEAVYTSTLTSKNNFNGISTFLSLALLAPLIIALIRFWRESFTRSQSKRKKASILFMAIAPYAAAVPIFVTTCDYGRLITMIICQVFFLVMILPELDYEVFGESISAVYSYYNEKYGKFQLLILCAYLAVLGFANVGSVLYEIALPVANFIEFVTRNTMP